MAIFRRDSSGAQQWVKSMPIYAAGANIKKGAFLKNGVTDGTNLGFLIPVAVNTALSGSFVGLTEAPFAGATLDNDPSGGTKYLKTDVTINPLGIYGVKYDNAKTGSRWTNGLSVTGVGATTVVTSGENIGGGWLFFDNGELHYVLSSSSGTYTTLTATSAAITTANKVAKILYPGAPKTCLAATYDTLGINVAAQGAVELCVITNFIRDVGFDWVELDPTKHDNLILSSTAEIWAEVQSTQHFLL